MQESTNEILSGSALKRIAVVTMLCDHLAYFLLLPLIDQGVLLASSGWGAVYLLGRIIGRIAFPLFCLLLVEGFLHTKSRPRYLARMLLFALISEIPFNLATSGTLRNPAHQNVFFTLGLGLCLLVLLEKSPHRLFSAFALLGFCAVALLLRTDYSFVGILLVAVLWQLREQPGLRMAVAALILVFSRGFWGAMAVLSFIPIGLYNGKRGDERHPAFFYWFYPLHLLLIVLIKKQILSSLLV